MFLKKLNENLIERLSETNLETAFPFQKKSISRIKSGGDLICVSDVNTGKSTTLIIGIIHQLKTELNDVPRAIIAVENNKKAEILKEQFDTLGKYNKLRVHAIYEGANIENERDAVYIGADIVIGTAKRLNQLYFINGINLGDLKILAIDDAHSIAKQSELSAYDKLFKSVPKCQKIIFSEKITDRINFYKEEFMMFPEIIETNNL